MVAKIDATANDMPGPGGAKLGAIGSYPTIKMKMASGHVEEYSGERQIADLLRFIDANLQKERQGWDEPRGNEPPKKRDKNKQRRSSRSADGRDSDDAFPWVAVVVAVVVAFCFLGFMVWAVLSLDDGSSSKAKSAKAVDVSAKADVTADTRASKSKPE